MDMRVLMFGWEFPPYISGGLGTACFGLTQSLAKAGVKILFVVPKADDPQQHDTLTLINASSVEANFDTYLSYSSSTATRGKKKRREMMTRIDVKSSMQPYLSREKIQRVESRVSVNVNSEASQVTTLENRAQHKKTTFAFSGTYGARLFEEVDQYAHVATELARLYSFDIIHAHDWLTYKAGCAAQQVSGKPLVIHVHATEFDRSGENIDTRVYAIEKQGMLRADHIIAVSQWTKSILINRYGIANNKISVVHNGVLFKNTRAGLDTWPLLGKNNRIVTFLGRITYQKGPQYFVEAAHKVLQQFPDTHFIMAGSGDLLPAMMEQAAQLKISSRMHFTGFLRSELVDKIWSITDLYVMPSVSEPFGITPLEAAQANVPIIISRQSGVSEVISHAIKVDFWDVDALANAICSILAHASLRKVLQRNVRTEVREVSWDGAAGKVKNIYYGIAKKTK